MDSNSSGNQGTGSMSSQQPQTPDVSGAASTVGGQTKDAARTVAQTAKEQASRVTSVAKDQATQVSTQAKTALRSQAEELKNGFAHTLDQAAVAVRSRANDMDRGDMGMRLAQPLERSADYLRQTPVENMPGDLGRTISANPMRSVAIAFGVGLLFGSMLKRR